MAFCYTIHKTPHISLFWSDGGNDDGVLLPMVLLLLFASQSDSSVSQSDKQKQVSLFVMTHILFLVHERNTHALCITFHASKKSRGRERENIIPLFIHLTFLNSTFSHQEKQSNSNLETLQNSLFSNIKKTQGTLPLPVQSQLVLGYADTRHTQTLDNLTYLPRPTYFYHDLETFLLHSISFKSSPLIPPSHTYQNEQTYLPT